MFAYPNRSDFAIKGNIGGELGQHFFATGWI
jgi:hypothetical protein